MRDGRWVRHVLRGRFGGMVGASVGGYGVAALLTPLVATRYGPDGYASWTLTMAFLTIVSVASTGGYELAIPGAPSDSSASRLFAMSGRFSVWAAGAALGFAMSLAVHLGGPGYLYVLALPVGVLVWADAGRRAAWTVRVGNYAALSRSRLVQGIATPMIPLGLSLFSRSGFALVGGAFLAKLLSGRQLASPGRGGARGPTIRHEFRQYPRYVAPAALLNGLSLQAAPLLLALFYPKDVIGQFGLVNQMLSIPLILVGFAFAQMVVGDLAHILAEHGRGRTIRGYLIRRMTQLGVVALASTPALIAGSYVAPRLLGDEWAAVGPMIRALTPLFVVQIVASPLGRALSVLGLGRTQLFVDGLRLIAVVSSFWVTTQFGWPVDRVLQSYALTTGAVYLIGLWKLLTASRRLDGQRPPTPRTAGSTPDNSADRRD